MIKKIYFSVQYSRNIFKLWIVDLRIDVEVPRMTEQCFWDLTFLIRLQLGLDVSFVPKQMSRSNHRRMEIQTQGYEA